MAKIQRKQATFCGNAGCENVYRQFADGHTEPADEDDVSMARDVRSSVVTRLVVAQLGVMRGGEFVRLGREDVNKLGTVEPQPTQATSRG